MVTLSSTLNVFSGRGDHHSNRTLIVFSGRGDHHLAPSLGYPVLVHLDLDRLSLGTMNRLLRTLIVFSGRGDHPCLS